ncbi:MAG: hypothetical protein K2G01_05055, partial [Paramuribaculum sp.]|nr:hypothetical protein [Paramuribaculum sp.]
APQTRTLTGLSYTPFRLLRCKVTLIFRFLQMFSELFFEARGRCCPEMSGKWRNFRKITECVKISKFAGALMGRLDVCSDGLRDVSSVDSVVLF